MPNVVSDPLLAHFLSQWKFVRELTHDLLASLSENDLVWTPDKNLGPWWKQFRHIGRVQENYIAALKTERVAFSPNGAGYAGGASTAALAGYLERLDKEMLSAIQAAPASLSIDWFGEKKSLGQHLLYLADHEVLHQGQWIMYQTQSGKPFPKSWAVWGL